MGSTSVGWAVMRPSESAKKPTGFAQLGVCSAEPSLLVVEGVSDSFGFFLALVLSKADGLIVQVRGFQLAQEGERVRCGLGLTPVNCLPLHGGR